MSFISGLSIFCIAETKDKALEDLIGSGHVEETVIVADSETVVETSKWITFNRAQTLLSTILLACYRSIQTDFVDIWCFRDFKRIDDFRYKPQIVLEQYAILYSIFITLIQNNMFYKKYWVNKFTNLQSIFQLLLYKNKTF